MSDDLHKRVERYEAAVDELRASHQDIRDILADQVLFEHWQQLGAELGYTAARQAMPAAVAQQPQMSEAWG